MAGLTGRIGILGGTFNPIHTGHLITAHDAAERFELSEVLLVPCGKPPHKMCPDLAPARLRMAMVQAAIEGDLLCSASDVEIRRGGESFAVDTVRELQKDCPGAEFRFIVGSDSLRELHLWKNIYKLLALCEFNVLERPGARADSFAGHDLKLDPPWPERLLQNMATGHLVNISSSDIRHRVAEGMSIRYLVPHSVEMYIAEHSLYT